MSISEFLSKPAVQIAGAAILPNLGGWAGGFLTSKNIKSGWYESLKFPPCRPPNYVFGPVWTTLYSSMGYASYVVWKKGGGFSGAAKGPLTLYAAQLALNWAWTPIFFHMHELKWVNNNHDTT
jgi:translocator protein